MSRSDFPPFPTERKALRDLALDAEVLLRVESARLHGLIARAPKVNVERCEECLAVAKEHGITLTEHEIDERVRLLFEGERSR